jgi:tetratricopeptide (TPR) repeat protein
MKSSTLKIVFGSLVVIIGAFIIYNAGKFGLGSQSASNPNLTNGELPYQSGIKKLAAKDWSGAKTELETAYDLGYDRASAPLGSCYLKLNDTNKAKIYLKHALDSISSYSNQHQRVIYNDLGILYHQSGKPDSAKVFWKKAQDLGSLDAQDNLRRNN